MEKKIVEDNTEWDFYHQEFTSYRSDQKVKLFNDEYGYFVSEDDKCYTVEGFKAIREVVSIVKGKEHVATCYMTTLWRRNTISYSPQQYIIGFDQHDQSLHDISMWIHDNMFVDDALRESVAMNLDCLEVSPSIEDKGKILDTAIDIAKHIGQLHSKKPVKYLFFSYSEECQSLDKIESTVALLKDTKSLNSASLNTQFWLTGMVNDSFRALLLKL